MSYTKGEWKIDKRISTRIRCKDIVIDVCSFEKDLEEAKSITKLILATPDMLEALKNWFECADEHDLNCRCGRNKAKFAIQKAEEAK